MPPPRSHPSRPPAGHRRASSRSPAATAGSWVLAALVVLAPLARGSVETWAQAVAIAAATIAAVLIADRSPSLCAPAFALAGVLGIVALQLVPVPADIHRLAPGAVRIFELSLAPLSLYPAARPMSLDPPSTARGLASAIAVVAAFVAAWQVSGTRRRRDRVVVALAVSGAVLAAVVVVAALAGAGQIVAPSFPFVNRNHLAAALNLSALLALALAVRARGQARLSWMAAFAAPAAVSVLTLSRGGFIALFAGAALLLALTLRGPREAEASERPSQVVPVAAGLLVALGVAGYLGLAPLVQKLGTLRSGIEDARWQLLRPAWQVLLDFPWLGVGRGAFSDVFAGYQLESSTYQFSHVENEWLQALLDLGVPGGLLLVGTFAFVWGAAARRRDLSASEIGLLAGTAAVAVQNAVDFSLDLLGVAIPFAVAMGLLARGQRRFPVRPAVFAGAVATLGVVAGAALLVGWTRDSSADAARVAAQTDGSRKAAAARTAAALHPADWYPHATAGVALAAEGRCGEAMPWLVRAMGLSPTAAAPHLAAARCLVRRNDEAARREYRLSILFGSGALPEAASRYPALDDLFDIAPATPDGVLALGEVLEQERPSDARVAYRRALDEYSDRRALLPLARVSARLGDHAAALDLARRHEAAFLSDPSGYGIAAEALFRLGRDDDADAEVDRGLAAAPGSLVLLRARAERAMIARRWSEARSAAEEIAPRSADEVAEKHVLVARVLLGQGRMTEAIERLRSAHAARPERPDLLLALADWCERAGRLTDAIDALRRVAALQPGRAGLPERIAVLEAARRDEQDRLRERLLGADAPGR